MLRCKHHKGSAVQCIRSCGINRNLFISAFYREIHLCTIGLSNPVRLHLLYLFRPVKLVQICQKPIRIFGNAKHPLFEVLFGYVCTAAFTLAVYYFFIGKACLAGRTPVNRHLFFISQSRLEHLDKYPLRPFIEIGVCRIYFHIPVIQSCDLVNLSLDISDIFRCRNSRMNTHFNCIVFCWESKRIPSHGMNDIMTSIQHFITAPDIGNNIASPMTYMKTVS